MDPLHQAKHPVTVLAGRYGHPGPVPAGRRAAGR